jgi:molecular chaperone IbpA
MVTFNTSNLMYGIGLDSLFNRLEIASQANSSTSYPPYNIRKTDDEHFTIEIAVAGFGKDDLKVELKEQTLFIEGNKEKDDEESFLHKGIATRFFKRSFALAEDVEVVNVDLINGILLIDLERIIPEEKKPRIFDIGGKIAKKAKKSLLSE